MFKFQKPQFKKKLVKYRKIHAIDYDAFCDHINNSSLITDPSCDLSTLVDRYESVLRSLLDSHAPMRQRMVVLRPPVWRRQQLD